MAGVDIDAKPLMTFGFLVVPEFPLYALTLATECLRVANQNAGRKLFNWHIISIDGRPVPAGSGVLVDADLSCADFAQLSHLSMVIACFGNHPMQYLDPRLLQCLRRLDRGGMTLGAIDTGLFALAEAGLLEGYRVTLHWEAIPTFMEQHPEVKVLEQIMVFDNKRISCAGGISTLDMMLTVIGNRCGGEFAQIVANGFIYPRARPGADPQRQTIVPDPHTTDSLVKLIVRTMESHIEAPLVAEALATRCGTSVRRMTRVFKSNFDDSPMRVYLRVRLQRARQLLFYSKMSISDISLACGFTSPPVFNRAFKAQFGQSPSDYRLGIGTSQLRRFFPDYFQQGAGRLDEPAPPAAVD